MQKSLTRKKLVAQLRYSRYSRLRHISPWPANKKARLMILDSMISQTTSTQQALRSLSPKALAVRPQQRSPMVKIHPQTSHLHLVRRAKRAPTVPAIPASIRAHKKKTSSTALFRPRFAKARNANLLPEAQQPMTHCWFYPNHDDDKTQRLPQLRSTPSYSTLSKSAPRPPRQKSELHSWLH